MQSVDYKDHDSPPDATASAVTSAAANAVHLARLLKADAYPPS
jgi:hypothetical protein